MLTAIRACLLVAGPLIFVSGIILDDPLWLLAAVITTWLGSLIYTWQKWQRLFVMGFFLLCFSVFLMWRPVINVARGNLWLSQPPSGTFFALKLLMLSLVSLQIGAFSVSFIRERADQTVGSLHPQQPRRLSMSPIEERRDTDPYIQAFATVSLILFIVGLVASYYLGYEKLAFMQGREYIEFFALYTEQASLPVRTLATFMPYALCAYLVTMPRKHMAFTVLTLYISTQLPTLLIGLRGRFMFAVVFAVVYYVFRHRRESRDVWLGTFEKLALLLGAPVAVLALNALNYLRAGTTTHFAAITDSFLDFFHKQGVSFKMLTFSYSEIPRLPDGFHSYTFGPIIDYVTRGPIGQAMGNKPLPGNNSVEMALESNSFSHAMSFLTHSNYLGGEGYGSSYTIELFTDFGWLGVLIGGIVLGVSLTLIPSFIDRGGVIGIATLYAVTQIMWLPRDSALGWVSFLSTPQFWLFVIICLVGAATWQHVRRPLYAYNYDIDSLRRAHAPIYSR
ncbi:MAG: O-antigen polysaccharide polymerase Wzy family protein [Actinomycetaceae bacterium]|nr:O-antigen polysaccharide polymerase Wzy family protein [Actinomycetaceae bacterium]